MKRLIQLLVMLIFTSAVPYSLAQESFCPGGSSPDVNILFCDSFESQGASASEPAVGQYESFNPTIGQFNRVATESVDGGYSLQYIWNKKGDVDGGFFQLNFGANPFGSNITPNTQYREIYWRFYVKLPQNFVGYPAKLTRARGFANSSGADSMIAHVWADGASPQFLKLDPASGIKNNQLVTTKWNDQGNLKWLGSVKDANPFPKGEWLCLEAHVKLNDAGLSNGVFDLSINGQMVANRTGLNWVGTWSNYGINAIMFSNYWNGGASADNQMRYLDAIVVSKAKIGCISGTAALRPQAPTNLSAILP